MLRDIAIALLSDRLNRTDITTRAINEMQYSQQQLEGLEFMPWFLLQDINTLATVAQNESVAVPLGFIREPEEDESIMTILDTTTSPSGVTQLEKNTYTTMIAKYKDSTFAQPIQYALVNQSFRFRPIPDLVYTLSTLLYMGDAVLTTNIENLWLKYASDLLIAQTGMNLCKYPGDKNRYAMFSDDYKTALASLVKQDTIRREASMDRTMGDEDA